MPNLVSVDFEISGKVQGVFFRKYTQKRAIDLGITGYVRNTSKGSVEGRMEGEPEKIVQMRQWLENVGSPKSKIDKAVFSKGKKVLLLSNGGFRIEPTV